MRGLFRLPRWAAPLLLALASVMVAMPPAQAQNNSREAAEAARKYRAEKAQGATPAPRRAEPAATTRPQDRPYRSSADPSADPRLSLRSCLNNVGMNPAARDRCMRQHCEGRWGQGDCPAGADLMNRAGASSNTPLGRCLREAGANPFRRDACGWSHCRPRWESAECQAIKPREREMAN